MRLMSHRNKKVAALKAYRHDAICEGKRFFESEEKALEAAEYGMLENMSISLGVYHCLNCGNWHLTSVEPAKEN